jgi:hypothetical protein
MAILLGDGVGEDWGGAGIGGFGESDTTEEDNCFFIKKEDKKRYPWSS